MQLNPNAQVFVTTTSDAAAAAIDILGVQAICAIDLDWSAVSGVRLVLWPKNDKLPILAMSKAAETAYVQGAEVIKVVSAGPLGAPGWDAAAALAEGWSRDDLVEWLRANTSIWEPPADAAGLIEEPPPHDDAPQRADPDGEYTLPDLPPPPVDFPFRVLGYNDGSYFYFAPGSQQVTELTATAHTIANLLTLAPLNYWEAGYGMKGGKTKFDLSMAANAMIQSSHRVGIFKPYLRRGRGAWIDAGRPVMHLGGTVFVADLEFSPRDVPSKFLYEAAPPLEINRAEPARTEEAQRLVDICRRLTWENPLSAQLLAGWCVIAPVCGALTWRPHIWITGASSSGKSTVVKDVIGRVVGPFAERVEGGTTEAGIRQALSLDARPVIMDEAEPEGKRAGERMDAIVQLARTSSSGAVIVKGSATGNAQHFSVRSCFAFSSINTAIAQYADETRISKMVLRPNTAENREQHFQDLVRDIHAWFDDDYAARMFARTVRYLPVLLKNIRTFTDAAASAIKNRRAADQIAAMCAGLYLCHSVKEIEYDQAVQWIKEKVWSDHAVIEGSDDENRLLTAIATAVRKVNGLHGMREMTIGEMLAHPTGTADVAGTEIKLALGRIGIRHEGETFIVSNHSPALERILDGTPWSRSWARSLGSLDGAHKTDSAVYFANAFRQRGVVIPMRHILDQDRREV